MTDAERIAELVKRKLAEETASAERWHREAVALSEKTARLELAEAKYRQEAECQRERAEAAESREKALERELADRKAKR